MASNMKNTDRCSFCGRSRNEVKLLISGLNGYICEDCAEQAHQIVTEEIKQRNAFSVRGDGLMKPVEIKQMLDQYVIGQDEAKRYLSVAVYNH